MNPEKEIDVTSDELQSRETITSDQSLEEVKREILNLPSPHSNEDSYSNDNVVNLNRLRDNQQIPSSSEGNQVESNNPASTSKEIQDRPREDSKQKVIEVGRKKLEQKGKKKVLKKGLQIAAKLGKKIAVNVFMAIMKKVLIIAGIIGANALLIFVTLIVIGVLLLALFAALFGSSDGLGDDGEIGLFNEYITNLADATVDSSRSEQQLYRVPEALISATIQVSFWHYDNEGQFDLPPPSSGNRLPQAPQELRSEFPSETEMIRNFTALLQPTFNYESFTDVKETQEIICEDGDCQEGAIQRENFEVERLVSVNAWNGNATMTYELQESEWFEESTTHIETRYRTETRMVERVNPRTGVAYSTEESYQVPYNVTIETINKERYHSHIKTNDTFSHDFTKLDSALTSMGYQRNDKELTEGLYEFTANQPLYYIAWLDGDLTSSITGMINFRGNVIPGAGVPTEFMPYYLEAQEKYNIPWSILASLHYEETTFSTHPTMISHVGAVGHMQFMPRTWLGWSYRGDSNNSVTSAGNIIGPFDISNLTNIQRYGGYGRDGSGNGKADPWDIQDAIHTAAYYLQSHNFNSNPRSAILAYNRSGTYADSILERADRFEREAQYTDGDIPPITSGTFMRPATGTVTSTYGPRASFGGRMHNGIDIGKNGRTTDVPIVSAADGIVTHANWSDSFGNLVIIQHNVDGQRIDTLYAHMEHNSTRVRPGDRVNKGDIIGLMGNTGRSFGAHLHFEVHIGGYQAGGARTVNPLLYIPN